ncbi:hypothetical protein JCM12298_19240 [Desulfothermus naphthae]
MNTTLRDLLNFFFRYIRYNIIFTIAVILLAGVYLSCAKKIYISKAKVLIRLGSEQMGNMQFVSDKNNIYVTRREQELKNEIQIIKSDIVFKRSAEKIIGKDFDIHKFDNFLDKFFNKLHLITSKIKSLFGLEEQKIEGKEHAELILQVANYLKSHLSVKALFESDTLELSFRFPNPKVAQKVLEIIINEYIKHHIEVYNTSKEVDFLKDELKSSKTRYEKLLADFSNFMGKYDIYSGKDQLILLIEKYNQVKQSLIEAKAKYEYLTNKLHIFKKIKSSLKPYQEYRTVEVRNRQYDVLRSKLEDALLEKKNLLNLYTKDSRVIARVDQEIKLLKQLLSTEPKRIVDTKDKRKTQVYETVEQEIVQLEAEVKGKKAEMMSLKKELLSLKKELNFYVKNLKYFNMLKEEVKFAKKAYEKIFNGFLENKIKNLIENRGITNLSLVEPPSFNIKQSSPKIKLVLIMAILLIFSGNGAILILFSVFDHRITSPNELAKSTELPVLGSISFQKIMKGVSKEKFLLQLYKNNIREFQKFFISLTTSKIDEKNLLFTKSRSGEGGTTICMLMALFFREYQRKSVVVVDFSGNELIRDHCKRKQTENNLFVKGSFQGVDLYYYASRKKEGVFDIEDKFSILSQLREEYEYVFVNMPALRDSHEFIFLRNHIDKVIFVVEAESIKIHIVKHNLNILKEYGITNIVTILNKRKFYIPETVYRFI